jgi:hypothetical protein
MKIRICLSMLLVVATALAGCGKWPPIVENGRDVRRLDANEPSVRARGLPDGNIPALRHLADLDYLDFSGGNAVKKAKISDAGLKALSEIPFSRLDTLSLGYCDQITDAGLTNLVTMKTVRWLSLMVCPNITDNGLSNLTTMTTLHALDLRGCPRITDEGLEHLARMNNLQQVLLGGCSRVSSNGVQKLQKALASCRVEKDEQEWSYHKRK